MATWNIVLDGFRYPIVIDILVNMALVGILAFVNPLIFSHFYQPMLFNTILHKKMGVSDNENFD